MFEAETGNTNLMAEPPRGTSEPLVSSQLVGLSLMQGGLVTAAVMAVYVWLLHSGLAATVSSNMAFVVLVAANAALILPSRSRQTNWRSLWAGLTPISLWVLGGTLLALSAISTVPVLAQGFGFGALTAGQWALAMAVGLCMVLPLQWLKRVAPNPTGTP